MKPMASEAVEAVVEAMGDRPRHTDEAFCPLGGRFPYSPLGPESGALSK